MNDYFSALAQFRSVFGETARNSAASLMVRYPSSSDMCIPHNNVRFDSCPILPKPDARKKPARGVLRRNQPKEGLQRAAPVLNLVFAPRMKLHGVRIRFALFQCRVGNQGNFNRRQRRRQLAFEIVGFIG